MTEQPSQSDDALHDRIRQLEEETKALRSELTAACESSHRKRLQATRKSLTHKFVIDQHKGYITVGLYEDGRPGEMFLTMAKEGSTIGGLMDTIGILASLALQYGVPVDALARKFEYVNFEPSGWTFNPDIRRASSVVDYVFRWLGMQFSDAYRLEKLRIPKEIMAEYDSFPAANQTVGGRPQPCAFPP